MVRDQTDEGCHLVKKHSEVRGRHSAECTVVQTPERVASWSSNAGLQPTQLSFREEHR